MSNTILVEMASREGQREIANAIANVVNPVVAAAVRAEIAATNADNSMNEAEEYKNNANQSASLANVSAALSRSIATELTEFLATKEMLTAPAIDATLSIPGAGADAYVTGESARGMEGMQSSLINLPFINGKNLNSNGTLGSNAKRIATQQFIDVTNAQTITYNIAEGYRMFFCLYTDSNEASFSRNLTNWLEGSGTIILSYAENFFRCTVASVGDETTVTTDDAGNCAVSYTSKLSYSLQNNTLMYRNGLGSAKDFDNITTVGMYNIKNGDVPANAPNGFTGGTLLVCNGYATASSQYPYTALTQILISPYNKNIWMRYCNSSREWRDWVSAVNAPIVVDTKWLAIGDSITKGVYSDDHGTHDSTYGWVGKLKDALGYTVLNKGTRGMGYIAVGGNGITFQQIMSEVEALEEEYNLVTVALGINDYNTSTITLAALEDVIDDTIQRLSNKFPKSRLIFITPFNSDRRGDVSSKYCCNYPYGGRSLKDIADLIQNRCDAFGVECINATEQFLFNVYNMSTLLPDQTHPSIDGHNLIAKTMAHLLRF